MTNQNPKKPSSHRTKRIAPKTFTDWRIVFFMLSIAPSACFAADVASIVDGAIDYLQGGVARSIGVAAIVVAGYLCIIKQVFPKSYFVSILVGLGLIFGASEIYDYLGA